MFPHGETVTRLRAGVTVDPYSQEVTRDWSNPVSFDIEGCAVADGGSVEPDQAAREQVTSDFDVIAPAGSDITFGDRLEVRGLVCEVEGRPFDWRSPFTGWAPGLVVRCKIVEG